MNLDGIQRTGDVNLQEIQPNENMNLEGTQPKENPNTQKLEFSLLVFYHIREFSLIFF